ncbi:MAG: helix-turn-helix transcriptional regulator [Clostridiales bacterium]|jgi:DNA-binding Xre family transcriptional regulator|nr:helix-turn-helix transcriptional regulator [Clostridiales bacterium]
MISYAPLWETMKRKNATTYTLRNKGKPYSVSGSTMERIKAGEAVSTNTLDAICYILECDITDIIRFIAEEKTKEE